MYLKKTLNILNFSQFIYIKVFDNLSDLLKNPSLIKLSLFQYRRTLQNRKKKLLFNLKSFSLLIFNIKYFNTFGLPSLEVYILMEEILLIIKAIYEPLFFTLNLNSSFKNFSKPNQKLLNMFLYQVTDLNTIFRIRLVNDFNDFDSKTFIRILNQRIIDKHFLKLFYTLTRFSLFYECCDFALRSFEGTNCFFEDIVFSELDNFFIVKIDFFLSFFNEFKTAFVTRLITQVDLKVVVFDEKFLIKNYYSLLEQFRINRFSVLFSKKLKLFYIKQKMLHTSKNVSSLFVPRIYYFRYSNNWYFFLYSEYFVSFLIKNKLIFYMEKCMNIDLNLIQCQIGNVTRVYINFWGFSIKTLSYKKNFRRNYFELNTQSLKDEFQSLGFLKKMKGKLKPREISSWSKLSDYEIILKYNSLVRGLVNYFSFIIKRRLLLKFFIYILEYSCYKTFSQKHRSTIRKLFMKYGKVFSSTIIRKNKKIKIIQTITLLNTKNYWNLLKSVLDFSFMFNSNL